eukprot:UN12864
MLGYSFGMSSCVQISILQNMSHPARSSYRRIYSLKVSHPATTGSVHYLPGYLTIFSNFQKDLNLAKENDT